MYGIIKWYDRTLDSDSRGVMSEYYVGGSIYYQTSQPPDTRQ